jgi:hypothetical protein
VNEKQTPIEIRDLLLYLRCPRAYRHGVVEGHRRDTDSLNQAKIHAFRMAVSGHHGNDHQDVTHLWRVASSAVLPEDLAAPASKCQTKGEKALEDLSVWVENYYKTNPYPQEIEGMVTPYDAKIGGIVFYGHCDMKFIDGDERVYLLFRCGSQVPNAAHLARDLEFSLLFYCANWRSREDLGNDGMVAKVYCYYLPHLDTYKRKTGLHAAGDLKGNPMIPVLRSPEFLTEFEFEISQVAAGIQSGYFPMRPDALGCSLCQYREHCYGAAEREQAEAMQNADGGDEVME